MLVQNVIQKCPVEIALEILGKKWIVHILRDMLRGKHRFSNFLGANPRLTTKVLSTRLKELELSGLINKTITSISPVRIDYSLTSTGMAIYPIIVELSKFSINEFPEKVFINPPYNKEFALKEANNRFSVALTE